MLLRPSTRARASAELGYRLFAGVVAGGFTELLAINWARDQNPGSPDYLTPSLVAAGVGLAVAIIDPPDEFGFEPAYHPVSPAYAGATPVPVEQRRAVTRTPQAFYTVTRTPTGDRYAATRKTVTNVNEARSEAGMEARRHPGDSVTIEGTGRDGRPYDAAVWADDNGKLNWTVY